MTEPPRAQVLEQRVEDWDWSRRARLRWTVEAPLHHDEALIEINVRPLEAGDLSRAHARIHGDEVHHEDQLTLLACGAEETIDLVAVAEVTVVATKDDDLRLLEVGHAMNPRHLECRRVVQHRDEQREVVRDRLRLDVVTAVDVVVAILDADVAELLPAEVLLELADHAAVVATAALLRHALLFPEVAELVEGLVRRIRGAEPTADFVDLREMARQRHLSGLVVVVDLALALPSRVGPADAPHASVLDRTCHGLTLSRARSVVSRKE